MNTNLNGFAFDTLTVIRDLLLKVRIFVGVKYEIEIEAEDAIQKISLQ
ncbi:hypothetical protein ACFLWR_07215 [Chloroflexota bacterium]